MNIKQVTPYLTDNVQASKTAAPKPPVEEKPAVGSGASPDRVQLSKDYQELVQAQKIVAAGEIRAEKVEQIKFQLESGSYEIQPEEIAKKMMEEIL